jgi:hypothetical protein
MKIDKVTECDKGRIPLAVGDVNGRKFVLSIFVDGSGCILEFENDKYILRTEEILKQILEENK